MSNHPGAQHTRPSLFWLIVNSICCAYSFQLLVIIFIDYVWKDTDETHGMIFAKESFMLYDLSTTFIWCFELAIRIHSMMNANVPSFVDSNDGRLLNDNGEANLAGDDHGHDSHANNISTNCSDCGLRCGCCFKYSIDFQQRVPSWILSLTKQQIQVGIEGSLAVYFLYDTAVTYYNLDYQVETVSIMTISAGITFLAYLYMVVKEYPKIQRMIVVASESREVAAANRSASISGYDDRPPTGGSLGVSDDAANYELASSATPMITSYQQV